MSPSPVTIITGASSGIGESTARLFAEEGYKVVMAARREKRLLRLVEEIESYGGHAEAVITDVTRLEDINNLVDTTLENYGQVDVLINNAGYTRLDWLENQDPIEDIEKQLQVNLWGLVQTTRAVLPHMIKHQKGHIINIASMAGWVGVPTYSLYATSKYGVRGFTEALRREVRMWGIHVSGVYPGGVATDFAKHTAIERKTGITTPKFLLLTSEDVARAVLRIVKRPRRVVVMPRLMWVAVWLNMIAPWFLDWIIEQRFTRPERGL